MSINIYIFEKIIYKGKFDLSVVGHFEKRPVERWKTVSTKKNCFFFVLTSFGHFITIAVKDLVLSPPPLL